MGGYNQPVLLEAAHVLDQFTCDSAEQTTWLRRYARQSDSSGTTRVFVVTEQDSDVVVAYYAWCMSHLVPADAPPRLIKGAGNYPQPMALLARLGVDQSHAGRGLGAGMLRDVLARVNALDDEIGVRGLLVHAETPAAKDFYLHLIPEFIDSPTDPLHLVLLKKDINKTLR